MNQNLETQLARPYDDVKAAEHRATIRGLSGWFERVDTLLAEHEQDKAVAGGVR